jgi:hypothetical protein
MKRFSRVLLGIALAGFGLNSLSAAERVDLLLVLTADVSRSVDERELTLQRQGYATAFLDRRVLSAVSSGPHARIAVAFVEWAGASEQKTVVDWMLISDTDSARQFGDRLVEAPRSFYGRTSISGAIDAAMLQLARAPYESDRRTIDVSGDGTHNSGRDVRAARDDAVAQGVTINGLVILSDTPLPTFPEHTHPPGGLANYYKENVVGGAGAFVMAAENFQSFGRAIINKLIAEIAALPRDVEIAHP